MSELVANCPRCKAKAMTFDLISEISTAIQYKWQKWYETFCICRNCNRSTVFVLSQKSIDDDKFLDNSSISELPVSVNQIMSLESYISLKDSVGEDPPEYLPEKIHSAFVEGAACLAIGCHNAGATMFRLCIDLATKSMLPEKDEDGLNSGTRRSLGLRIPWLFKTGRLPESLSDLSKCIKDDGNDGAHDGSLTEEDAEDILDFTFVLLERMYTEPKRIELAKERRNARRKK